MFSPLLYEMQVEAWPAIMPLRRAMQCNKDSMNAVEYIGLPLFHHSSTIIFSQLLMLWEFLARIKKKQAIRNPLHDLLLHLESGGKYLISNVYLQSSKFYFRYSTLEDSLKFKVIQSNQPFFL